MAITDNSIKLYNYCIDKKINRLKYKDFIELLKDTKSYNWKTLLEIITYFKNNGIIIDFNISEYMDLIKSERAKNELKLLLNSEQIDSFNIYLSMIQVPLLSKEDEKALFEEYIKTNSNTIRNIIFIHNLRLVINIAKRYYHTIKDIYDLDFLDIIQIGNMGLLFAIDRFNPDLGYKFSTYATCIINQFIYRHSLSDGRNIKIPSYISEYYVHIKKATKALTKNDVSKEPTLTEIATYISEHYKVKENKVNEQIIKKYLNKYHTADTISLSIPVDDNEESENKLINLTPDPSIGHMEEIVEKQELNNIINKGFEQCLTRKEAEILKKRFGFDDGICMSLTQIADSYHVTRERIRQIETHAKSKLERYLRSSGIKENYFN